MCSLSSRNAGVKNIQPHLLAQLNGFVETRMGLHFPPTRLSDLERGICAAAVEFGFSHVEAFIEWLLSTALSHSQIQTLAGHLTVGETYFFRDKRVFEILRSTGASRNNQLPKRQGAEPENLERSLLKR